MSSSRARSRFAAIAAAVPLLIAGGPLVAPAFGANEYTVANLLADGQVVGPNTGFLGLGVGETGTTAMFKVTPPTTSASIESIELTLTQLENPGTYIYQNELDTTDGLSLYEDVNDNGSFDAADKATGLKSNGFRAGRVEANGDIPFLVTLAGPASGAADYFIAIHPAATAVSGRHFTFQVGIGDITGSAGNGPINAVSTPAQDGDSDPRMLVDSAAPATPGRDAFTPTSNVPGAEDTYTVPPAIAGGDSDVRAIFFNAEASTAPAAILTRVGYDTTKTPTEQLDKLAWEKVVDPAAPTLANAIPIGDGSGLFHGVAGVAKNNQVSNAVFARLIDNYGNMSAAVVLSDCFVAPNTTACETARGNPVIGPETPTGAELGTDTAAGKIVAINKANEAAVPVAALTSSTSRAARTTRATASTTNADTSSLAVAVRARVAEVASGVVDETFTTATKDKAYAASATTVALTGADAFDTTLQENAPRGLREGVGNSTAVVVNLDRAGNPSQPKFSATPYTKDITAPTVAVHTLQAAPSEGDEISVQFSEPMDMATITASGEPNPITELCGDNVGDNSAEKVLDVADNLSGAAAAERTWGYGYCFEWGSDGGTATITIGGNRPPECDITPADDCIGPAAVADVVKFGSGANALTDKAGNLVVGDGSAPFHTTIVVPPPSPVLAETRDVNADGRLDGIYAEFSSTLSMTSVTDNLANFSAVGGSTVPITSATMVSGDPSKILFAFTSEFSTGDAPTLRLSVPSGQSATGVTDSTGNKAVPAFSKVAADKAVPQPKSALTVDDNKDGQIDKVTVLYTEKIQHDKDNNPAQTNLLAAAYNVAGYAPAASPGVSEPRNPATPTTGDGEVKTLALTRPNTNLDTGARPLVKFTRFTQGSDIYGPTDLSDNVWANPASTPANSYTLTPADGAAPVYATKHTRDLDSDGKVDAIDLKFSENIPTVATGATFEVTGHQILDQFGVGTDGIRILIDETAPASGDTAASMAPTIKHISGVQDAFGNAMSADANPVAVTDGAGPAIMSACSSSPKGSNGTCPEDDPAVATDDGTKMNVFFSEALTAGTVAAADFVVEQPAGTAKTIASVAPPVNAADGKSSVVTITFAQGTLSNTVDSVVRLSGAGVVADAANVVSTQVSNVTAYAPPVVTLALSCPVPANPGYCSTTSVNTGASGTPAVTKWRLKETARGTVVDPADYSETKPTTVTLVEGEHTLYLSGMDGFGRLSPEVSGSMTVLTAPQILNVQMVNAGPRDANDWSKTTTLMDGDNIKIGADAYGTDAAQWASGNQATGGGCLAAHMSIDVRGLTGRTNDGAVAPLSCDLKTTTTPPYRQMQFPVVKVLGTTKYPVGTVIRTGTSDPGSMVVDGPNGTQRRRQFISANARRSWTISDASVITVPSALLTAIPRTTNLGYRDGAVLRSPSGCYYYMHLGKKRPVSTAQLAAWRIPTSVAYRVSVGELNATPTATRISSPTHQIGTWIRYSNGAIYQIVRKSNGATVRRQLAAGAALRTRVPSNQVYPANSYDSKLPVDSWLLGYRDGTVVKLATNSYGVFARGSLRKFANPETFNTLGYSTSNALPFSGSATPRVRGQSYRTGLALNRYKITSTVIKVTNKAGAAVTATVLPTIPGVYGVGQVDPIPAGWDMTR